jgi:hypothetical protein
MTAGTAQVLEIAFGALQIVLLTVNAWLLWKYVKSTAHIEQEAVEQSKIATRQADISQQQAKFAADQLEGSSRPVLVMRNATALNLELANVGNGPALNIQWWIWPEEGAPGSFEAPTGRIGFIAVGTSEALPEGPMALQHPTRKIWCRYSSVGGSIYISECLLKRNVTNKVWYEVQFYPELSDSNV